MTADVRPMLKLAVCPALLALVLLLNVVLHHDAYVPARTNIYLAPTITTTTSLPPAAAAPTSVVPIRLVWDRLADCESGDHDVLPGGRWLIHPGTARWTIANRFHQGGLQFAVTTWDSYRLPGFPADAQQASRAQQIIVAERVLARQGWGAWPTCAPMIGAR